MDKPASSMEVLRRFLVQQESSVRSVQKKATNGTPDRKLPPESRCSPREIQNHLDCISGPLLDRIDIHIEVPPVQFREI